jgi:hypothetical protein
LPQCIFGFDSGEISDMLISIRKTSILTALLLVLMTSISQAAPTPTPGPARTPIAGSRPLPIDNSPASLGPLSAQVDGLALALVPHRRPYVLGKAAYITLHFVNKTRNFYTFNPKAVRWNVSGPNVEAHTLDPGDDLFAWHGFMEITPRTSESGLDMNNFVTVRAPGTYSVQATVTIRELGVAITSPPVTITIR